MGREHGKVTMGIIIMDSGLRIGKKDKGFICIKVFYMSLRERLQRRVQKFPETRKRTGKIRQWRHLYR